MRWQNTRISSMERKSYHTGEAVKQTLVMAVSKAVKNTIGSRQNLSSSQ